MSFTPRRPRRPIILATAPGCPHCGPLKAALQQQQDLLDAQGWQLTLHDLTDNPAIAQRYNIRAVPWLSIDGMIFQGALHPGELQSWLSDNKTLNDYLRETLAQGQRQLVAQTLQSQPQHLPYALTLLTDPKTPLDTRLGLSLVLEQWLQQDHQQAHPQALIDALIPLSQHPSPEARADAIYLIGLSQDPRRQAVIGTALNDPDADVRDIAQDALNG